jgi:hypothetical protein
MNMPVGPSSAPPKPPEIVRIDVDFDGTIGWNGEIVPDRAALEARLSQVAALPDQPEVHLRPNKLVSYKYVAMVMASPAPGRHQDRPRGQRTVPQLKHPHIPGVGRAQWPIPDLHSSCQETSR